MKPGLILSALFITVLIGSIAARPQAQTETKLIESIVIRGYRNVPIEDITDRIRSKRGEKFDAETAYQDFERVMTIPAFDRNGSQLIIEYGVGGDISLTFVVNEPVKKE